MKLDISLGDCPICSSSIRLWRHKHRKTINYCICTCSNCGFGFVNPRPSLSELQIYYRDQGHSEHNPQTPKDALRAERTYPNTTVDAKRMVTTVKEMLTNTGSLLDVGCGYGFFAREAIEHGFQVMGLELADTERTIAQQISGIQPLKVPFEEFEAGESFDVILMSQVLEHAAEPVLWIRKAYQLLREGGVLAIAVPNFSSLFRFVLQEKDPFVIPPAHLNYFSVENLRLALEINNFRVNKSYTISRLPPNFIAQKLKILSKPGVSGLGTFQSTLLTIMDATGTGMFINIYARKTSMI